MCNREGVVGEKMSKKILYLFAFLLIISTITASSRSVLYTSIAMTDERDLQPGGEMVLSVSVINKGSERLKDVDITVSLPDYQIRQRKQIDRLRPNEIESTRFYIVLPDNVRGYEYVKITINHDDYQRTIYREIRI